MKTILALDPATACGWALWHNGVAAWGTWDLRARKGEGAGARYNKLRDKLIQHGQFRWSGYNGDLVVYEDVRRHAGTIAAHVYGGLKAVIQMQCERAGTPYEGRPVGTIKKHATGKGNATKQMMLEAAREKWGPGVEDDNQADALWLMDLVIGEGLADG